jgi:uncharacterized membrane protein
MTELILEHLEKASHLISLFAVVLIVIGFLRAAIRYAIHWRSEARERNFEQFKIDLGHALTLVLEVLVLADVIDTIVVTPTFQSLGVLAFLVGVRTIMSWTLFLETEGRWPWQENMGEQAHA